MAADDKEDSLNEKAGTDAKALASAPLGQGDIAGKEGEAPKENLLADVDAPAEAIAAGVIAINTPKERSVSGVDEASSFFSYANFSPETKPVPLFIV